MNKDSMPWLLSAWFISLLTVLLAIINPMLIILPGLIIIPILIILHTKRLNKIKGKAELLSELKNNGYDESIEIADLIVKQKEELEVKQQEYLKLTESLNAYKTEYANLKTKYVELEDEVLLQSFGFFEPKYDLEDSAAYKIRLSEIRNKQKEMVIKKDAASFNSNWTVNGSKAEGRKMNNNLLKLAIRSFNNECDVAISKVKVSNIKSMEDRINRTFEIINKLNASNQIQLKVNYLNLKHEELYLALEYNQKLEKEKEEQREIREQIKEEEKARREIAKLKEAIEKEEKHFIQALEKLESQKENATQEQLSEIELKIAELNQKLEEVNKQKEDVLNRERNTRAGYVYVISNIGSFGEDVYKIGMTRRLEPLDRVKELGSASVPFLFDVHAMIFSEDAPTLENTLHRTFNDKRLNLINERKEFFKVSLEEIQDVVERNHDKTIEFKTTALAEDYRQTIAHRKQLEETKKELVIA
ncbi:MULTISPECIES: DUF4041 domain-containing protein [unclassified Sporosarcina]|uniref:DUF4041 domain-containing protein n=1 Tax=unclassified Sporosarcina TaxID=2647733 RepID=UPI001E4EC348|nr:MULTISPECIES: DUF4041 domain-containing protein [unclassified Sporosarcina]